MATIVVGGSTKDIGKTALVCAVIHALRDFAWTAVKITGHDYAPQLRASDPQSASAEITVWEETKAGQATDTARYLAAGARRALLVTRTGPAIPIDKIRAATQGDCNIIFESNRIMEVLRPDVCIALIGGSTERKSSFERLLSKADVLVSLDGQVQTSNAPAGIPVFVQNSAGQLSPELENWLRARLNAPASRLS